MGLPNRKKAHLKSKPEIEVKYECAICGSEDVEGQFWVGLNTEKPDMTCWDLNDKADSYWCHGCSESVEINEIEVKKPS